MLSLLASSQVIACADDDSYDDAKDRNGRKAAATQVYQSGCNVDVLASPALRDACDRPRRLSVQLCGFDPVGRPAAQFSG